MRKYLAEGIGTFAIVFCGTGAIIINEQTGGIVGHMGISLTFGLIVMLMINCFGSVSGAHFNPAVSLALAANKKLKQSDLILYILSQLIGAIAASAMLSGLFPNNTLLGATLPAVSDGQSFCIEYIITFLLMLVILRVAKTKPEWKWMTSLSIGSMIALAALFAGPICGASMNPARSIGPALISGNLDHIWLYIAGPILGALSALGIEKLLDKTST